MSAILLLIAGNFPIGSPNCLRSLAYLMQVSMIRCIAPRWLARMQIRSHSIDDVKTACPPNSLPSKFSTRISQSCSESSATGDVRNPILCSFLPTANPGVPLSTRNAVTPFGPRLGSRFAKTIVTSAFGALLLNVFDPFSTYLSPLRSARVFRLYASDPDPGSVMACNPSPPLTKPGRYLRFCSSVPNDQIGISELHMCALMEKIRPLSIHL